MNINLIVVGNLKEKYWVMACDEYLKRLKAFGNAKVIELSEVRLDDNPSQKQIENCLEAEGKKIKEILTANKGYNIAMCIEGKQLSSVELSQKLESIGVNGMSTVNIVIGSSFGMSDEIKNMCDFKLSMSKMTFPHQLARVMLLEQIYRAFSILKGSKYHK